MLWSDGKAAGGELEFRMDPPALVIRNVSCFCKTDDRRRPRFQSEEKMNNYTKKMVQGFIRKKRSDSCIDGISAN